MNLEEKFLNDAAAALFPEEGTAGFVGPVAPPEMQEAPTEEIVLTPESPEAQARVSAGRGTAATVIGTEVKQQQPTVQQPAGSVQDGGIAAGGFAAPVPVEGIQPIPRNTIEKFIGDLGAAIQSGAEVIDFDVVGLPGVGSLTLKDLTVGDIGKVMEAMSYGFMPVTGAGQTLKPTPEALDLLNAIPAFKAASTIASKGGKLIAKELAPTAARMGEEYLRKTGMIADIVQDGKSVVQQAPKSDIGFYSAVENAAINVQRKSGTGQSFLNDIMKGENVKAEEIKWIGLDEFLKGKKNVTKQEVQDYIANNKVDVKEVTLGGAQPFDAQRLAQLESEYKSLKQHPIDDPSFGEDKYDEMIRLMNIRDQSTTQTLYDAADQAMKSGQRAQRQGNNVTAEKYFREAELLNTRAEKLDLQGQGMSNPPKFGKYQLAGGENYREILLTMPNVKGVGLTAKETERLNALVDKRVGSSLAGLDDAEQKEYFALIKKREESSSGYKSSHWDQPNVLAHLRVNDRVDADGKKMLLIEEVQSDWHQAGRDKGYNIKLSDIPHMSADDLLNEHFNDLSISQKSYLRDYIDRWDSVENGGTPNKLDELVNEYNNWIKNQTISSGVPDAPFKDTWYQLALKRALQYAADNGYDRVGLTTGAQQAERYDLSKQVDKIVVPMVNADGTRSVRIDPFNGTSMGLMVDENGIVTGYTSNSRQFTGKKLDEVVGKEIADKVMKANEDAVLEGLDLQVGGEGMKKYYDEVYPKFLEKYGKKWGAKVGNTKVNTVMERAENSMIPQMGQEPVRYIEITPAMRESVKKGQPLFTAAPIGAATGATMMRDEEKK